MESAPPFSKPMRGERSQTMNAIMDTGCEAQFHARQAFADEKLAVMGQFASGMLHDFNNMLGIIAGNASLALQDMPRNAAGYEEVLEISHAARRAQDIANHILAIGRSIEFSKTPVSLNEIMLDSCRLLKSSIKANISFKAVPPSEQIVVNADRCLIEQVIVNLCKNAIQAMPHGGSVTVKCHLVPDGNRKIASFEDKSKTFAAIKVIDTGCGIPAENLLHIFEPFFTTKPGGHGTGLGLFISKYIIQNHGGQIHANSIPGMGTIFSVLLPLA
jgi:signal transduction histidine kinase